MGRLFPPLGQRGKTPNPGKVIMQSVRDIHVFDIGGGYYHTTEYPKLLAEGAVMKNETGWYIKFRGSLTPINFCNVPAEAKTTILLLGLDI